MHRQGDAGVPGQVPQVLAHLRRPGGAVQPDQVDAQRLQRGQGRADLAAEQHRAGGLHGDLGDRARRRGRRRSMARRAPTTAALACSRSWAVSTSTRRRRRRAGGHLLLVRVAQLGVRTCPARAAWCPGRPSRARTAVAGGRRPRRRPPGPAGHPPRPARRCGRRCRTRPGWPGWRRRCWSPRSRPRRQVGVVDGRTRSGRVTLRISLQPSCPSKSSRLGLPACSIVPIAPSATRTRRASADRRETGTCQG
jgi:hypothetical protein